MHFMNEVIRIPTYWKRTHMELAQQWSPYSLGIPRTLTCKDWIFNINGEAILFQHNGWDCGLCVFHFRFCLGLQASLSDITPNWIYLYLQKLLLYCLIDFQVEMMDFQVEICCFPTPSGMRISSWNHHCSLKNANDCTNQMHLNG